MTYKTVICTGCGWAAFAVSRAEAERQVEEFRAFYQAADELTRARFNPPRGLDSYACQQCGGSSFRPEAEDDRIPAGVTLAPVIWEALDPMQERALEILSRAPDVPPDEGDEIINATPEDDEHDEP